MSSGSFAPLSEGPTKEALRRLRERLEDRMKDGAQKISLAKEIKVAERTLSAFIARPDRTPHAATWALYRAWFNKESASAPLAGDVRIGATASGTLSSAPPDPPVSLPDPVVELVRRGQAEQAAWVLEFAAKLLEAGAQRLRQGIADFAVQQEIEGAGEAITRSATGRTGQSPPIQSTG